jgi:hypothetical protein
VILNSLQSSREKAGECTLIFKKRDREGGQPSLSGGEIETIFLKILV